jgi:hypothetical protein
LERERREKLEREAWMKHKEEKHNAPGYRSMKEKKRARRAVQAEIAKYSAMTDAEMLESASQFDRASARRNNIDVVDYMKRRYIRRERL